MSNKDITFYVCLAQAIATEGPAFFVGLAGCAILDALPPDPNDGISNNGDDNNGDDNNGDDNNGDDNNGDPLLIL